MTSDHIKRLADQYMPMGVTTADKIEPPKPKPEADHKIVRRSWPRWKRDLFDELQPHALAVVSTKTSGSFNWNGDDGTIIRPGHNRSFRAIRFATSGSLQDTITPQFNNNAFGVEFGVQLRLWTDSKQGALDLKFKGGKRMIEIADVVTMKDENGNDIEAPIGWTYVTGFDLSLFELELFEIARIRNFPLWDDEGLSQYLDQLGEQRMRKSGRGL